MRDYMDRRVTPPKRVTSPTWGPPPSSKQALSNDDGDGNEKGKNEIGWRKNNFARFFVHCTLTTT